MKQKTCKLKLHKIKDIILLQNKKAMYNNYKKYLAMLTYTMYARACV